MTKPLALIYYQNLLSGSKLLNRLQDLGYKVLAATEPAALESLVVSEKPLVVIAEVPGEQSDICRVFGIIKSNPATSHIPVLAYVQNKEPKLQAAAVKAGADLVALDNSLLPQLPQLLEQILQID